MPTKPYGVILNLKVSPALHLGEFIILNYLTCPFLHNSILSSMFKSQEGPNAGNKPPVNPKLLLPSILSDA